MANPPTTNQPSRTHALTHSMDTDLSGAAVAAASATAHTLRCKSSVDRQVCHGELRGQLVVVPSLNSDGTRQRNTYSALYILSTFQRVELSVWWCDGGMSMHSIENVLESHGHTSSWPAYRPNDAANCRYGDIPYPVAQRDSINQRAGFEQNRILPKHITLWLLQCIHSFEKHVT